MGGVIVGHLDADTLLAVAVLTSNAALLIAVLYMTRMVSGRWGADVARRTILCLLVFPTTIFLSAAYPESLFLALSVVAFWEAHRGRWWLAGLLGGLAALARTYGVLIVIPLAWEYFQQHHWHLKRDILWLGLIPAGLLAWQAYLFQVTGDPLVMRHAQDGFARSIELPWQVFTDLVQTLVTPPLTLSKLGHKGLDASVTLVVALLVVLTWRLRWTSLAIFASVLFLIIASGVAFDGVPRYTLELFPVFIVMGQLTGRRLVFATYLALAIAASLVITSLYSLGWWVA
jgi:hypothetical protein